MQVKTTLVLYRYIWYVYVFSYEYMWVTWPCDMGGSHRPWGDGSPWWSWHWLSRWWLGCGWWWRLSPAGGGGGEGGLRGHPIDPRLSGGMYVAVPKDIIHILTHKMNHIILCVLEGLLLIPAVVPDPQWSCWSCSRRCWKGCTVRPLSPKTKTHQSMSFAEVGHKKYIRRETIEMSRFHVPRNPGNVEIPYAHVCSRCMTFFLCP